MSQRKYEKFEIKCKKKQTRKLIYTIYMQRILKSENLQFEKQELERKMKFYIDSKLYKFVQIFS